MAIFKVKEDPENRKIYLQIDKMVRTQHRAIRKAFYYIGKDLARDAKAAIMQKPKHGRLYTVILNGRSIKHRASAAGEAPANLSGDLKKSVDFHVTGSSKMEFGYREIFTDRQGRPPGVFYGKHLELGTSKMDKRPNLLPTIQKNYKTAQKHFDRMLKKYLEKRIP